MSSNFGENSLFECASQPKIAKITKNPLFFLISRSFKVIDVGTPESSSAVLVMINSKSVSICNPSHARRANSGKICLYYGTFLMPSFEGISSHSGTKFAYKKTRSPYLTWVWFGTVWYRVVTDRRTDGQTDRHNYNS